MEKETTSTVEAERRVGETTDLPHDRITVQRFRETFPSARWSDRQNAWFVPGPLKGTEEEEGLSDGLPSVHIPSRIMERRANGVSTRLKQFRDQGGHEAGLVGMGRRLGRTSPGAMRGTCSPRC